MTRYPRRPKISKARIIRSVASSSAIETGTPIKTIEAKLKTRSAKYAHLQLSL